MDVPAFDVTTALSEAEIATLHRIDTERTRAAAPATSAAPEVMVGIGLAVLVAVIAARAGLVATGDAWRIALLVLLAFAAGAGAMLRVSWRTYRRAATGLTPQARLLMEPRRFLIGDAGIEALGASADAIWRWRAFSEAHARDGLLLLHADLSRTVAIPHRAFAGPAEADAALAYCRNRVRPA